MARKVRVSVASMWQRISVTDDGCWAYDGYHDENGRPKHRSGTLVYRTVYEELVGPIPEGLDLDHTCEHPWCVRPDHLEPVTAAVNTRRYWARRTRCRNGHPWDEPPYVIHRSSGRKEYRCRKCVRANNARASAVYVSR